MLHLIDLINLYIKLLTDIKEKVNFILLIPLNSLFFKLKIKINVFSEDSSIQKILAGKSTFVSFFIKFFNRFLTLVILY